MNTENQTPTKTLKLNARRVKTALSVTGRPEFNNLINKCVEAYLFPSDISGMFSLTGGINLPCPNSNIVQFLDDLGLLIETTN